MLIFNQDCNLITGPNGSISVREDDEITIKLLMLFEGECLGLGSTKAAQKFGYSKQRYFQLLHIYQEKGAIGLQNEKRGPKSNYRRTEEIIRQVIRHRFLDAEASADVIAQKLRQCGENISTRSVERIIEQYGLQKKTLRI